ncbi:MAG: hypothetical protein RLZZ297_1461, partial [Chloroflexota bacterium]
MTNFPEVTLDPTNPDPRVACVLCLDVSGSMAGAKIDQLNVGLQQFFAELMSDSTAVSRVEVAIVTFGPVNVVQPFAPITAMQCPTLVTQGDTPMAAALMRSVDLVTERKQLYRTTGIPYYRPWIFLVTDGEPTDPDQLGSVSAIIKQQETEKRISLFTVGVEGANMGILNGIGNRPALGLK